MAREALLTIDCSSYSKDIADIIMLLNKIGWGYAGNQMEYLPLNDNDMFDWKKEALSLEKLFAVISEKQNVGELTGVILYHSDSDKGITVLARNTKEINLSIDINRKTLEREYTDISWYITNIVAELEENGCMIEHLGYREQIG